MSLFGCHCSCRFSCSGLALIVAAIAGVLTAFLQISGVIAISAALTGVFFAIAVGYLAVLTLAAALARRTHGCCRSQSAALAGIVGTIGLGALLLVVDIAAASVLGAILAGALVFFFALTVGATACYAKCLCQAEA